MYRFGRRWSGWSGRCSIWSRRFCAVGVGRGCSDLFGFGRGGRGGRGGALSGRSDSAWSELVGFVQIWSEVVGVVGAAFYLVGAILCGRSWSGLFRFVRVCTGLVGSGRGACRWASVGPLFCCGERRYHGRGEWARRRRGRGADSRSGVGMTRKGGGNDGGRESGDGEEGAERRVGVVRGWVPCSARYPRQARV